ncbi:DUF2326 domain-containing protein [Bacillus sp. AFS037270]|uniref:DUF2326 domain-containing protein n=1 Tax=Bacillus sp. AFS037270 TaxID=2033499 RepID=UPI000BFC0296|nr:DUF2326 domain-containing protein [Bacillus sp. AFS037270]PGV52478.1 hypothetical protein COD92_09770 [Bacillus sp. AFS037270]
MLTEIRSVIFQEESIKFHEGLNVVLGDNNGSNSIGKSTLLMIIDFIFGGNTYLTHNSDVVTKLGNHDFWFTFEFKDYNYHFIRGTEEPSLVYRSNNNLEKLDALTLSDFTEGLKNHYELNYPQLNFRAAVSTFSRVWGKNNYNVKKPLHNHPSEKNSVTVANLIKLFNKFETIAQQDKDLKKLDDSKKVLNKGGKLKLIPKINKSKYEKNVKEIQNLNTEIEKLGKSAYSPSINIKDIVSDELIQHRKKKKELLEEKEYYQSRLNRIRTVNKPADAGFESLLEFFPNVNLEKLRNIELFHKGISSILSDELKNARKELVDKIQNLDNEINLINQKLEQLLNPNEELNLFIDNLIEFSSRLKNLQLENEYYTKLLVLKSDITSKTAELAGIKEEIVKDIRKKINDKLKEINDLIHEDKRTAPELDLTYSNYEYNFFENTGTGKAYTNLIIFDLAISTLTNIPFIIHDSFLFKNIEKEAIEEIIKFYNSMSKQVFIAIDVINIYNKETQDILNEKKVIQLSKDKLLTTLDWRDNKK